MFDITCHIFLDEKKCLTLPIVFF
jgi:hypothetical protein